MEYRPQTSYAPTPLELKNLGILFNSRRYVDLESQANFLLGQYPNSGLVWEMFGLSLKMQGKNALHAFQKTAELMPNDAGAHYNLGSVLKSLGQLDGAAASFRRALELKPDFVEARGNLGNVLKELGQFELAAESYRHALQIKPGSAEVYNNLGGVMKELGKLDKAAESFAMAVNIKPNYADAHFNLGNIQKELKHFEMAVKSYQHALEIIPDLHEAHNSLGIALRELGILEEALASCRMAVGCKPDYAEGHNNLGIILQELGKFEEALDSYRYAVKLKPDYAGAHNNMGCALRDMAQIDAALDSFRRAVELKPDYADAHHNLSNTLWEARRHEEAITSLEKLLSIKPDFDFAFGRYVHCKMHCCTWKDIDNDFYKLLSGVDSGKTESNPFALLATPANNKQLQACAETFIRNKFPEVKHSTPIRDKNAHGKIRLGYFSADFHSHATAYLIAELLERHDRIKFEIIGFSFGPTSNDYMSQRIRCAFDRFIDVNNQTDQAIATLASSLEIDIAVDLKGFTHGLRTGIFSRRPAPIQVSYLGYPGTMGASYIDYLIADPTLIPVEHQQHYSEKIAYLPDTYQVNDSHRKISERQFKRSEAGLPDDGFVFCCFNNNFKITPVIFDIWMQLLKQVEGSVLWLLKGNELVTKNLHDEAIKRGIAPERLVFAQRMDLPDHLARHKLADLFLDTFYCNAHTTASDALWAGLPVLTCLGDTFAGRVAASLLNAIGLPELVTHSHGDYTALAIELATHPEKLASIKQKLQNNIVTQPLFNTSIYTRHIEDAYIQMWERHQLSLPPGHIYVRRENE